MIEHTWYPPGSSTGYEFGRYNPSRLFFLAGAPEGMGDPEYVDFVRERTLSDGQSFSGFRAKERYVFWPIGIAGAVGSGDMSSTHQLVWPLFPPGRYGRWRVTAPNGTWRELLCRFTSDSGYAPAVDPSMTEAGVVGFRLAADDPWWRGATVSRTFGVATDPVPFFTPSGGASVLQLMPGSSVSNATLTNTGEIPTWPIYRLDGPITSFRIGFNSSPTGIENISGSFTINAGEYLEIDTDPSRQTILLNGTTNYWPRMTSTWFQAVPVGAGQPFYVTVNGTGSVTASFVPRYRRAF